MAGERHRDELGPFGADDADWEGPSIVFDVGGRLDLPEGFVVPPLRLAPPEDLAAAAREAPAMARLAAFADWVGKGRRLGEDAELEASEQQDLGAHLGLEPEEWLDTGDDFVSGPYETQASLLTEWATVAGLVHQRGRKLLRTAQGRNMYADPLAAWRSAFDALLELGVVGLGGNGPPWGETVDAAIPDVIVLANAARDPLALSDVVDRLCAEEQELLTFTGDDDDAVREAIGEDASVMVNRLSELGLVLQDGEALSGTPLGTWAAVRLLEEDGLDVPLLQ